jgi:pimeloyl-ACP methyl ester carboxylesterase
MRVQVGDVKLFYDVEGAKLRPDGARMREVPTIVLLHGGPGGDHALFKPAYGDLADVAQLVYLDHRGQGRSDRSSPERWNLTQWADDVKGFCDALEIERPIVLGVSFGGFVAIAYGIRYPDHPSKLVFCCTRAGPPAPEREAEVFERLGGKEAGDAARRYLVSENPDNEAFREFVRLCRPLYSRVPYDPERDTRQLLNFEVLRRFRTEKDYIFDYLPDLARIKCPTLVTAGEDDPRTPPFYSEQIVAALPADLVRFVRFANAGHGICADAPEDLFQSPSRFHSRLSPCTRSRSRLR